jgi:AraC-like DNA-binding protein
LIAAGGGGGGDGRNNSMRILALLPDNAHHLLERSLIGTQCLIKGGGAESVASWLREGRCDAFVFDPGLPESKDFNTVIGAVNESGVPMLLYATLRPVTARRIVNAVDLAPRELMLRGFDDVPEVLQRKLAALVAPSAPALLLSRAASHFRPFPDRLQALSVSLFCRRTLPRWVTGFVCESGLARRTVDRWMDIGGISGAARLLDTARLARVWEPLVECDVPATEVAVRFGYSRLRLLTAHVRRMTGVAPLELRDRFTRETFGARLADALID